jgi:beta-galactosidase
MINEIIPFSTGWLFGPAAEGSSLPGFDDSGFEAVTLPHTVAPLSWQEWDPAAWERVWVYRKHFDAFEVAGRRVFLDFGAAMTHATVTLNGTEVGDNLGGYLPFSCEITGVLERAGNVLAVRLDSGFNLNVPPDRPAPAVSTDVDFWQPGGIYRDVRLRVVPEVFLADVFAKPVNVLDAAARQVVVQVTVDAGAAVPAGTAEVAVSLHDDGVVLAADQVPMAFPGPGQTTVTLTVSGLDEVTLWDTDRPRLYHVVATLLVDGRPRHDHRVRIGFREARFALDGFYLNGRRVTLLGVNRHQFFPFAGGAMPARVQARDAEIIRRELNCTMVRCSHYPQSEAFYDACDELGLLAWEEAPGWGYLGDAAWLELASRDTGQMIVRDRNHPSIVIWGARLNETPNNVPFYTSTNELAHALDDSRPTAGAMAGMRLTTEYEQDVFAENDYSSVADSAGDKQPSLEPPVDGVGRPYLVTEAVGTLSGPARYYRRTDTQAVQQGQATAHARVHAIAAADSRYCGVLAWSGIDYPSGSGNQYRGVKYTGVVDLFREAKPGAAIYRAQVDPLVRPVIAPAFYWDFGPVSPVTSLPAAMICANLDRLEVYVAGAHFASVTPDAGDFGSLAYPPSFVDFSKVDGSLRPELRIDGYLGSELVASRSLASDPSLDVLALAADDHEIDGDGVDATRVVFRAVDRYGSPRPYVTGQVTLGVDGPAVLVGDSPFDFAAAGGVGAAWIRSLAGSPGTVTVSASHPDLGEANVRVRVRPTNDNPAGLGLGISSPSVASHAGREVSERQRVLEDKVQRHGEHQVHKPERRAETKEAQHPLSPASQLRQVRFEAGHEISGVDAGQADEHAAYWVIADLEEDDDPEDRNEQERDAHSYVDPRVGAPDPVPAQREPVHAVGGERQRRHVERWRLERAEQGQAGEQVDTGDELHETGHPDAPHAGGEVNGVVACRVAEELLRAVDEVARPEAEEADGQGREGGLGQAYH